MATVTYIPERTQSKTAMGKVMRYCVRQDKTAYELDGKQIQLISGKDCCAETACREFMATKQQYGKANGMFFYQYVQSFSPAEKITPQKAHEIGCQFAEYWKGHEVLIATHTDAEHIHTHFIINSVSHETGKKLQMARGSIHDLRKFSDEICKQHDLSIVQPKQKSGLRSREYRAAVKGDSWKFKLMNAIDTAMASSQTKAEFIRNMEQMGYGVKWIDHHKYITYTTPDGHKCRDNKLHDEKYLKGSMTYEFEYRNPQREKPSEHRTTEQAIPAVGIRRSAGSVGSYAVPDERQPDYPADHDSGTQITANGKDIAGERRESGSESHIARGRSAPGIFQPIKTGWEESRITCRESEKGNEYHLAPVGADEVRTAENGNRLADIASDLAGTLYHLSKIVDDEPKQEQKKYVPKAERRHKQKQKQSITRSRDDWEMEM